MTPRSTQRPLDPDETLDRWRVAKRLCLGLIVMLGSLTATIAIGQQALMSQQRGLVNCQRMAQTETFGGVGILISAHPEGVYVRNVLPDRPAQGEITPGSIILSVDGKSPGTLNAWTRSIRGQAGESVVLELRQPDGQIETVELERELIQSRRRVPAQWTR